MLYVKIQSIYNMKCEQSSIPKTENLETHGNFQDFVYHGSKSWEYDRIGQLYKNTT